MGTADTDQEKELLGPLPKLPGPPPPPKHPDCAPWSRMSKGAEEGGESQARWQLCQTPYGGHYWPQRSLFGARVSKVTACAAESVGVV